MKNMVDYKNFRLNRLNEPAFCHLKYLLYWPVYGLFFLLVERLWIRDSYFPMHCAFDDRIPFCELFLVPYLFWFVYLIGFMAYSLFFDTDSFRRLMRFIIVTYTMAMVVYLLFPNGQELRPAIFERDNILTQMMPLLYGFDTNTNVCPSIHVIGSFAVAFSAWHSKHFSGPVWRTAFMILAVLISVSTVFLKQHSVLDILAAIPVCVIGYLVAFYDVHAAGRFVEATE